MSTGQTVLLGAIAGLTIFVGLPVGRMRSGSRSTRTFLSGVSAGILVFLLFDILEHATEPVEEALVDHEWTRFGVFAAVYLLGLGVGLLGLLYVGRAWRRDDRPRASIGPGAMAVAETDMRSDALRVGMAIATGIGLHNFSEGLAIGQSAAQDEVSLALLLVIGFGLHNATEGFGIVAPLSGSEARPSWRFLGLLGLIGGGPTFLGTLIGQAYVSEALEIGFLALAAGSILYVVMELMNVNRQLGYKTLVAWGILLGLALGFGTDFILEIAGA